MGSSPSAFTPPTDGNSSFQPAVIPGYTHAGQLGHGAWFSVHLYHHNTSKAVYAFKFFDPTLQAKHQMEERGWNQEDVWKRECLGGNTRSLPGLAYGSLETAPDGQKWYREEYLDRFLSTLVGKRKLNIEDIITIASGTAAGLQSLHTELGVAHGDLKPENIAYTTRGDVKLSDFGVSTVGSSAKHYVGEELLRAPERFSTSTIRPASDVWSFGALLYRMFTGKYVLEDELAHAEHKSEIVRAMHQDPDQWNAIIDTKLAKHKKQIPKAFRSLLRECLRDEASRIQDGKELEQEVGRAIQRYGRSTPKAVAIRYTAAAAVIAVVGSIAAGVYFLANSNKDLEKKLAAAERELGYEQKLSVVKLYAEGRHYPDHFTAFVEAGKLEAWFDIFDDKKTAIAAYLNHDAVARAILKNNGAQDFRALETSLRDMDDLLVASVYDVSFGGTDWISRQMRHEASRAVVKQWQDTIGNLYQRLNELAGQYRDAKKKLEDMKRHPEAFGPAGIDMKSAEYETKKEEVIETLVALTGEQYDILETKIADASFTFMPDAPAVPEQHPQESP